MTDEDLKKYKEHIKKLKQDFHKENPENIEETNLKSSSNTKSSPKQNINDSNNKPIDFTNTISSSENKKINDSKPLDNDINNKEKSIEKNQISKPIQEIKPETKNTIENKNEKSIPKIEEKKQANKAIQEIKLENNNKKAIASNPKKSEKKYVASNSKLKSKIISFLIPIGLIIVVGSGFFLFLQNDYNKKQKIAQQKTKDSVLLDTTSINDDIIPSESENNIANSELIQPETEDIEVSEDNSIKISDTIFNIISNQPEGYYAILGSYTKLKNAKKFKNIQKTNFEAVVFDQNPIRVGVILNENNVFNDLEQVKMHYPSTWLIFNKN